MFATGLAAPPEGTQPQERKRLDVSHGSGPHSLKGLRRPESFDSNLGLSIYSFDTTLVLERGRHSTEGNGLILHSTCRCWSSGARFCKICSRSWLRGVISTSSLAAHPPE